MRLEPLYRIRFTYPESWEIVLEGGWQQHFYLAEGRCEGSITGRFRGGNFPLRRGESGPFRPDFRAAIETDDGATIMFELHGYGRPYPPGRREIVGAVFHLSDPPRRVPFASTPLRQGEAAAAPTRRREPRPHDLTQRGRLCTRPPPVRSSDSVPKELDRRRH